MPRSGWVKPESDRRLSDLVSVGLLTRVFPAEVIDEVIAEAGRTEQRHRALPARVMAYFSIGMALYAQESYEDVFAALTDGLSWTSGWSQSWTMPSKSGIFQARSRLGHEPVRDLFTRVARPLAGADTPGSWLAGRRLVAIDGTCLDLPDTDANAEFFGRPGSGRGEKSAYPQSRVVAVAECGTHALFDAVVGPCTTSEVEMTREVVTRLQPGMLVLADRGLYGFDLWSRAAATGADLLWRVTTTLRPRHVQTLPDGSWLAEIAATSGPGWRTKKPLTVRVLDYTLDDGRDNPEQYRLLTTILDPEQADAVDLAFAYAQRWEIENTFDELKTHQRGPRAVLRSQSPDLVLQEIWGHLCCHYAIRTLMVDAARAGGHDPDRMSFVAALRVTRRSLSHSAFPPSRP
ncbi:IS4 family transposase [Rhodococcus pyridinivorans]|uniref:IS4 family transposase n=1 Tax=Rhodococcus pyridinivorans TaxID=103816 RepID=UPI00200A9A03|nr:IS4 family transposase [Rhodococcus pyridinivorans]UPW04035.1 IS4 family transposase [Rhodococcus pyridinivorans]UPW05526.1 IS4 family transposase [Rhodococcus pyridinivorans]